MPRYSKKQNRTKPQGDVSMPVPIAAGDERRWRSRSTLSKTTPDVITPGRRRKSRVSKMEKLDVPV